MRRVSWIVVPVVALLMAVPLALGFPKPVHAAAPRLALVYGELLPEPVLLDTWDEAGSLLAGDAAPVARRDLDGRPFARLALFWGQTWVDYADGGGALDVLGPDDANQQGRFYPAWGDRPAVVLIGYVARRASPEALRVLALHRVPIRIVPTPGAGGRLAVSWFAAALLALGASMAARHSRPRAHGGVRPVGA